MWLLILHLTVGLGGDWIAVKLGEFPTSPACVERFIEVDLGMAEAYKDEPQTWWVECLPPEEL